MHWVITQLPDCTVNKQIIELRKQITEGEDFVKLVKEESDDSQNDGHLGTFGKGQMVAPFEKAAFSLKPSELSEPVKTQYGWHLIKLLERKEPEVTPFSDVKESLYLETLCAKPNCICFNSVSSSPVRSDYIWNLMHLNNSLVFSPVLQVMPSFS